MSFPSDQSQASMDTALSSLQSSPTQPEFPRDRVPGKKKSNKRNLLLFFDGTGNEFSGTEKDTNVVKLLSMLDRNHEDQFHYYQSKSQRQNRTSVTDELQQLVSVLTRLTSDLYTKDPQESCGKRSTPLLIKELV